MPHFADRLSVENFMIYDEKRELFGVHPARKDWYLVTAEKGLDMESRKRSDKEETYQELFTLFHQTIAIKERENNRLQRCMCPIRYQDYMVEFIRK